MTTNDYELRITEADHASNAFWSLGEVVHEAAPLRVFEALPEVAADRGADYVYIADLVDEFGDVVADKIIDADMAQRLLDEPIPVLRERYRRWLFVTYGATG